MALSVQEVHPQSLTSKQGLFFRISTSSVQTPPFHCEVHQLLTVDSFLPIMFHYSTCRSPRAGITPLFYHNVLPLLFTVHHVVLQKNSVVSAM